MTPLEQATQATVAEQVRLHNELKTLRQDLRASEERENVLRGQVIQFETA
jgi:hypothetical protein